MAKRDGTWHRWFAWRPVRASVEQTIWLETVDRRWWNGAWQYWAG